MFESHFVPSAWEKFVLFTPHQGLWSLWAFSFPDWQVTVLSASSFMPDAPVLEPLHWTHSSMLTSPSYWRAQYWTQQFIFPLPEQRERITSLDLLSTLLPNAAQVTFSLLGCKGKLQTGVQICVHLDTQDIPCQTAFQMGHALGYSSPWSECGLYSCWSPKLLIHFSILLRSSWITGHQSGASATLSSFVFSVKSLRVCCIPSSGSLIILVNSIGTGTITRGRVVWCRRTDIHCLWKSYIQTSY